MTGGGGGKVGYSTFITTIVTRASNRNDCVIVCVSERLSVRCDELGSVDGLYLKLTFNSKPFNLITIYQTRDADLFTDTLNHHYEHIVNRTTHIRWGHEWQHFEL